MYFKTFKRNKRNRHHTCIQWENPPVNGVTRTPRYFSLNTCILVYSLGAATCLKPPENNPSTTISQGGQLLWRCRGVVCGCEWKGEI